MLLTIDIGNTNIKIGAYQGERLTAHWRVTTERHRLADEYLVLLHNLFDLGGIDPRHIDGCAISCVVPPLTGEFRALCHKYFRVDPLMVNASTPTGLQYKVDAPAELGADRIANSLAAFRRYGGPVIVLAFGTATTFDVITATGEYIGGAIAPGIGISADALFRLAAKLYQVELVRPPKVIGTNTIHHMQSGVILGYAGLVEGLVRRMQAELGTSCPVVATGGLAELIAAETEAITTVEPYLTLDGLRLIYEMNRQ
ncbi:type III pantothenate kinase [Roseiflexus castenholzii]|uniref:Type III pantothenate kinase n=1 Tax=Roseiflexus castenholzii (strain DSM 13941 / HLO8) TaxID=383372 RepID=COAX_ROSCS|nr:type III pantothenate kinase [Roseiflexus castenholzii]A7NF27.1 RecName: Full=Type III pantothenate kinase; AltName: Full=PanK-III; AltName: Full=Pantothenic acid kinase [Roseiflexus castenholzii DSM 13941]ABU57393.1 putative transcriptional acitvator, Baf family [Roseiflexus castenholzii DSM 13941]